MNLPESPVALLIGRGGEEYVWTLPSAPPSQLLMARRVRVCASVNLQDCRCPLDHRVFELNLRFRSKSHRWLEVYNEGRSATPHDGFVYLERS